MTQAQTFIILQTAWDFFLITLSCGIFCYWVAFWYAVLDRDYTPTPENKDMFTQIVLRCRELRRNR